MIKNSESFKLSMFNLYLKIDESTSGVYNTLHDSALVVDKDVLQTICETSMHGHDSFLEPLIENKMLVPHDFDEKQYFIYYLNKMKYSPVRASYILTLTSSCNLDCPYCFEGRNKNGDTMSPVVAERALDYIIHQCEKNTSVKNVEIAFYGGEPLLNRDVMKFICEKASSTLNNIVRLEYTLVSNLTLLMDSDIELLKHYSFTNIQVAIDGPPEIHDKRRISKTGDKTFDLIFSNILKLVDNNLQVVLILNFDESSWHCYSDLIPIIKAQLPYKRMYLILNPLSKCLCNTSCGSTFSDNSKEAEIFLKLYNYFRDNDISIHAFGQDSVPCMLNRDMSEVIDPKGLVYKCGLMLGKPEFAAGSIFDSLSRTFNYKMLLEEPWKQCLDRGCVYLPICGGGCRTRALIEAGDLSSLYCRKNDYYDHVYSILLRDHFKELIEGG